MRERLVGQGKRKEKKKQGQEIPFLDEILHLFRGLVESCARTPR